MPCRASNLTKKAELGRSPTLCYICMQELIYLQKHVRLDSSRTMLKSAYESEIDIYKKE